MKSSQKRLASHRFGLAAEKIAAFYLRAKGYRILAERYRNFGGEIDILARRGKTVVAVEVKARKNLDSCMDSITSDKQQRIIRATNGLLSGHGKVAGLDDLHSCNIRFDVIFLAPWRLPLHIQDAWRL
ncbi:MAG: YraN family protein [Alphaproteobacteria bacterium]|nr:YraN family protein [Alphaproteobacteria bacterium]